MRGFGSWLAGGPMLVCFADYDLGYFDLETRVVEPLDNPFSPKLLPM
jgi:putative transposase